VRDTRCGLATRAKTRVELTVCLPDLGPVEAILRVKSAGFVVESGYPFEVPGRYREQPSSLWRSATELQTSQKGES
jgi:hypothetical protein